jgi:hypothetical protein
MVCAVLFHVVMLDWRTLVNYSNYHQQSKPIKVHLSSASWREEFQSECQGIIDRANGKFTHRHWVYKEYLERKQVQKLYPPPRPSDTTTTTTTTPDASSMSTTSTTTVPPPHQSCKAVFIDLGTNRGDSIAYALDAALDVCTPLWIQANPESRLDFRFNKTFPHPHLDVGGDTVQILSQGSKPIGLLKRLQEEATMVGIPFDEWCVYGMEGNPYFTPQLQNVQDFVNALSPRPLKQLHIYTESVISDHDEPTNLYVDTHSVENHVSPRNYFVLPVWGIIRCLMGACVLSRCCGNAVAVVPYCMPKQSWSNTPHPTLTLEPSLSLF